MTLNGKQILVLCCAVFAAVIAFLVIIDAGAVAKEAPKWLAGAVFVAAVGLGLLAAP